MPRELAGQKAAATEKPPKPSWEATRAGWTRTGEGRRGRASDREEDGKVVARREYWAGLGTGPAPGQTIAAVHGLAGQGCSIFIWKHHGNAR